MTRLVGLNHVALEVDSIEQALTFWESLFGPLTLRGRLPRMAFIDMGDQFVALAEGRTQPPDEARHIGIVVDDKEAVRAAAVTAGITVSRPPGLDIHDPWGNLLQIVDYRGCPVHEGARDPRGDGPLEAREDGCGPGRAPREGARAALVECACA